MYKNLDDYISRLERENELLRIDTPVSNDLEIAEITDRVSKQQGGGKALFFTNTPSGFSVLTNMMGSDRRIALALGVDNLDQITQRIDTLLTTMVTPKATIWDKLKMLPTLAAMSKWLPKRSRWRGECQQVVWQGDDISLDKIPILKCWPHDGGRFVTLPMVNTIDPNTGAPNVGMYRMQVMDNRTTGMHWHIHKTGARHYEEYRKAGIQRMPVSVAIGGDPAYAYAATAPMPDNMDEYLLAGFLRGKSVKLVKSLTNDIYIPSDCDFVIEGYVDTTEPKVIEGPFGDHTGFYSLTDLYPRFHVTTITHRRGAVYPATIVGIPPQEDAYIAKATEKIFVAPIRLAIQPEVCDMTMPEAGTAHNIALFSIAKRYVGQPHKVIQSLWGAGQMMFNKYIAILPEECNLRDNDSLSQYLKRLDVSKSAIRSEGVLDVLDHATATLGYGGKMALDLTDIDITKPTAPIGEIDTSFDTSLLDEWGVVMLFCDSTAPTTSIDGVPFILHFNEAAKALSPYELVWLAAANSDPRRDVKTSKSTIYVDARAKHPSIEGHPSRFPNVVTSSVETIELVDKRWSEYMIGEMMESPSRHYRNLLLSEKEQI